MIKSIMFYHSEGKENNLSMADIGVSCTLGSSEICVVSTKAITSIFDRLMSNKVL